MYTNPVAQAIKLDANGDFDFKGGGPRLTRGVEAARGALVYRFGTQAGTGRDDPGEWKYDYRYGVLWRQAILGSYFSPDEARSELADVASRTTGVGITAPYQISLDFDPGPRKQFITILDLRTDRGETVQEPVTIPAL